MKKILLVLGAMLLATPALAIDFDRKIVNMDGSPILDDKGHEVELTLRSISVNALMLPLAPEEQAKPDSGMEKQRRETLARHVLSAPRSEAPKSDKYASDLQKFPEDKYVFTAEDIVLLKKLINNQYPSPLVVSQAWRALEEK